MLNKSFRLSALFLLAFNGIGAIYGGLNFILSPDGSGMEMSPDFLKHSPFHDYLIPGIILLVVNGLFSVVTFLLLIMNMQSAPLLVMSQGFLLCGWIFIQVLLIQVIIPLHVIMGSVGILLILLGRLLGRPLKL